MNPGKIFFGSSVLGRLVCMSGAAAVLLMAVCPVGAQPGGKGPPPAPVSLCVVEEMTVETKVTLTGGAEPARLLTLAAAVEGIVAEVLVEEGDHVDQGRVLLRLDAERFSLRLAEAKALLTEAKAILEQRRRDLKRNLKLRRTQSLPEQKLEEAQTLVIRQEAVVARQTQNLAYIKRELADSAIRTPLAGVVVSRQADLGEWIKKGGAVLDLAVLDPIKVVVPLPERFLSALVSGDQVSIRADALPGQTFAGKVSAIIPQGNANSRTFPVHILVKNPQSRLKPGMLIRAVLRVGRPHKALLVPKDALVITPAGYSVFTVQGGLAAPLGVRVLAYHKGLAEVRGPLKPGMQIVISGNERLRPGQPVVVAGSGAKKPPPASGKANP